MKHDNKWICFYLWFKQKGTIEIQMQTSSSSFGSNFGPKWISAEENELKTQYPLPPFKHLKLEEGDEKSLSIPIVIPGEGKDTSIENLFVQQNWSNMALKGLVQFTISSNHIAKKEHIESIGKSLQMIHYNLRTIWKKQLTKS